MSKLTILRGLSGSGKSTWANSVMGAVVVSRDSLRAAIFGSDGRAYYERGDLRQCEQIITEAEHSAIRAGLSAGKHVISDNTNIETKFIKNIANIGYEMGAEVELKVFDVSLPVAKAQNKARALRGGRNVPNEVIEKQYARFQSNKNWMPTAPVVQEVIPYHGTPDKPYAYMFDIDGTLASMNGRGPFDWKRVGEDSPRQSVITVLSHLDLSSEYTDVKIILMSGRDSVCRPETVEWLEENNVFYHELFMRAEGDMRKDNIIKHELFNEHIRDNYDVIGVFDDRWQVCKMWLEMGLTVFNVSGLDRGEF